MLLTLLKVELLVLLFISDEGRCWLNVLITFVFGGSDLTAGMGLVLWEEPGLVILLSVGMGLGLSLVSLEPPFMSLSFLTPARMLLNEVGSVLFIAWSLCLQ